MVQFVLKIEKLSHIMGPRASQDLRSQDKYGKKCGENVVFHFISGQECRQLKYSQPLQDRALTNHEIIKINTTREDICKIRCFIEPNCLSFNVGPLDDNHQYLCEISDSDEALHPRDLVPRRGFTYQGTQVFLNLILFPGKGQYRSSLCYYNII